MNELASSIYVFEHTIDWIFLGVALIIALICDIAKKI